MVVAFPGRGNLPLFGKVYMGLHCVWYKYVTDTSDETKLNIVYLLLCNCNYDGNQGPNYFCLVLQLYSLELF